MKIFEGRYSGKEIFKMTEDIEGCFDATLNEAFNSITPKGKDFPTGEFTVVVKWNEKATTTYCLTCGGLGFSRGGWGESNQCWICNGSGRI